MANLRSLGPTIDDVAEYAPQVTWSDFIADFNWRQGEHVGLIGPTESGKTTVAMNMLDMRAYMVVFATKPRDRTLNALQARGYARMNTWKAVSADLYPRRIIWPDARDLYSAKNQKAIFREALQSIYMQGSWGVYIDELWYIIHHLKLEFEIRTYLQQARSSDISLMVATQRPAFIPLEVYDQSTHLFFWRDNDERNLRRIGGISWLSSRIVQTLVANLAVHEFLYINTRAADVQMVRSMVPKNLAENRE